MPYLHTPDVGLGAYAVEMQSDSLAVPVYSLVACQSAMPLWTGGGLVASGDHNVFPGLMQVDSGSVGIGQAFGNWSLYAGGNVTKYGFYRGVHTQLGVNANITCYISPSMSITAFGSYYFGNPPLMANGMPMPAAMAGFYNRSVFGGYATYSFSNSFGLMLGAQAVQQLGTQQYRIEPIATPYFKIGKVAVGLPVGEIANGIINDLVRRKHR